MKRKSALVQHEMNSAGENHAQGVYMYLLNKITLYPTWSQSHTLLVWGPPCFDSSLIVHCFFAVGREKNRRGLQEDGGEGEVRCKNKALALALSLWAAAWQLLVVVDVEGHREQGRHCRRVQILTGNVRPKHPKFTIKRPFGTEIHCPCPRRSTVRLISIDYRVKYDGGTQMCPGKASVRTHQPSGRSSLTVYNSS